MATTTAAPSGAGRNSATDLLSAISSLDKLFGGGGGKTTTTSERGRQVSPAALQSMIRTMQSQAGGLASILQPQRTAGLYNSSVNQLLAQQYAQSIAGKAAELSTPESVTETKQVSPEISPLGKLAGTGLAAAQLYKVGKDIAKVLGISGAATGASKAADFSKSIADPFAFGPTSDSLTGSISDFSSGFSDSVAGAPAGYMDFQTLAPDSYGIDYGDLGGTADAIPYMQIATNLMDGNWNWSDTGAVIGSYFGGPVGATVGRAVGEPVGDIVEGIGGSLEDMLSDIGDIFKGLL